MKTFCYLSALLFLFLSCSESSTDTHVDINVSVVDKETMMPIDSATVFLIKQIGNNFLETDTFITNDNGTCICSFILDKASHYRLLAMHDGYLSYLIDDSTDIDKSEMWLEIDNSQDITLFLTSDTLNHINYWNQKAGRYEMDFFIKTLLNNEYHKLSSFLLPVLIWDDIPHLIEYTSDATVLTNFPHNGLSSYSMQECYMGMISMWLIESIRYSEEKNAYSPFERLPSLNPIFQYDEIDAFNTTPTTIQEMNEASRLYKNWWERVKDLNKEDACKINPLEGADFNW